MCNKGGLIQWILVMIIFTNNSSCLSWKKGFRTYVHFVALIQTITCGNTTMVTFHLPVKLSTCNSTLWAGQNVFYCNFDFGGIQWRTRLSPFQALVTYISKMLGIERAPQRRQTSFFTYQILSPHSASAAIELSFIIDSPPTWLPHECCKNCFIPFSHYSKHSCSIRQAGEVFWLLFSEPPFLQFKTSDDCFVRAKDHWYSVTIEQSLSSTPLFKVEMFL